MDNNPAALVVFFAVALPAFIGAYLIGVKKMMFLIAGWDPDKFSNPDGFAVIFGWALMMLGINSTLVSALDYYQLITEETGAIIILISAGCVFAAAGYGNLKFKKKT